MNFRRKHAAVLIAHSNYTEGNESRVVFEEADNIQQANQRASFIRNLGARVEIYRLC
jgi:hypothetical protein